MTDKSKATQALLFDTAERLFMEKGFAAVTLQDIASEMGMRHASLYYYAPKGKEQLYVQVMERAFRRHGDGLTSVIMGAGDNLRAQMHAVAVWFATHPPLDLGRIVRSDMPGLTETDADHLITASLEYLRVPIAAALQNAIQKGEIMAQDVDFAAMGLIGLLQSVHNIPTRFAPSPQQLTHVALAAADMLLDGLIKRH